MKQINLRLDEELIDRLDADRGNLSRNAWLAGAVRLRLGEDIVIPAKPGPISPAPSRTPEERIPLLHYGMVPGSDVRHSPRCSCGVCQPKGAK